MKEYISLKEAAEKLSLKENTLRKWIVAKKLPFVFTKLNGAIRIRASSIDSYMKKKEVNQIS